VFNKNNICLYYIILLFVKKIKFFSYIFFFKINKNISNKVQRIYNFHDASQKIYQGGAESNQTPKSTLKKADSKFF